MVDVATGWTECLPLVTRDGSLVVEAMKHARSLFPWLLRGVDFDNDSAFMNDVVVPWCREQKLEVTRSRAYKKNDQAFVEQKNGAVVRRLMGYGRFDGVETARVMARLYAAARLYVLVARLKWMPTSATSSLMRRAIRRLIETMRSRRKFGKRHSCLVKLFRQSARESTQRQERVSKNRVPNKSASPTKIVSERREKQPVTESTHRKVKTALDESRLLILGAQILLGFHLNGAFQSGFGKRVHGEPLSAACSDPARDVLGRVRLDEEGIEGEVFRDRGSLRRGEYQGNAKAVSANVSGQLHSVCDGAHA
jgi:hypothetical protein